MITSTSLGELAEKLKAEGHTVELRDLSEYDLVLGPNCIRVVPELVDYIGVTIKEAQRGKYERRG